ncbi:MAG: RT0821/Lpp0805 family surface protein [Gammaproteobacteria bacterium]|nr:RT0821/Lpp0805 family surface protein [Gammaproteobacteria bacterium]
MTARRLLTSIVLLATLCAPSQASNLRFLEYSPSAYFNDEDWKLMRAAVSDALDNKPAGETVTWRNDDTGHHGAITPLESFEQFNTTCRKVRVSNEAGDVKATRLVNLCKDIKSGEWKIVN